MVFAAASLQDVLPATQPEPARLRFNFAGTQQLRTQLENGAYADVFASADRRHMEALSRQGLVEAPELFACNRLVVVVPATNPAQINGLGDLVKARRLVLAAPEVPAGRYAEEAIDCAARLFGPGFPAEVRKRIVSRELNVRQALGKVALGEADAAIVYRTDAQAAKDAVRAFALSTECDVLSEYPIAVVAASRHKDRARAFIAGLSSAKGRAALEAAGFTRCDEATAR